jgi:hypothetical protein
VSFLVLKNKPAAGLTELAENKLNMQATISKTDLYQKKQKDFPNVDM